MGCFSRTNGFGVSAAEVESCEIPCVIWSILSEEGVVVVDDDGGALVGPGFSSAGGG